MSPVRMWRTDVPVIGNSKWQGCEAEAHPACSRNGSEAIQWADESEREKGVSAFILNGKGKHKRSLKRVFTQSDLMILNRMESYMILLTGSFSC